MWKVLAGWRRQLIPEQSTPQLRVRFTSETLLSALDVARDTLRRGATIQTTWDVVAVGGTWRLTATTLDLWGAIADRQRLLHAIQSWCTYRGATEIVITTQVIKPPGLMVIGLSSEEPTLEMAVVDWFDLIAGGPVFDGPEWLTSDDVDDDFKSLLPDGVWELDEDAADALSASALGYVGICEQKL